MKKKVKFNCSAAVKKYFTINGLVAVAVALVCGLISLFVCIMPAISDSAAYNDKVSAWEKSSFDYIVYDPTDEQVAEVAEYAGVEKVFAYYSRSAQVNSKTIDAVFSSYDNANISPFNSSRLVSGKISASTDEIVLDKKCAENLKVKIGDKITLAIGGITQQFTVGGIVETNAMYQDGCAYFTLSDAVAEKLAQNIGLRLKGIMVQASDKATCYNSLRGYIPWGRCLKEEAFSNKYEYEDYVKQFAANTYEHQIYNKDALLNQAKEFDEGKLNSIATRIIIGAVVAAVVMLLLTIETVLAVRYLDERAKAYDETLPFDGVFKVFRAIGIAAGIALIIVQLAGAVIAVSNVVTYGPVLLTVILTTVLATAVSVALLTVANYFILRKAYKDNDEDTSKKQNEAQ